MSDKMPNAYYNAVIVLQSIFSISKTDSDQEWNCDSDSSNEKIGNRCVFGFINDGLLVVLSYCYTSEIQCCMFVAKNLAEVQRESPDRIEGYLNDNRTIKMYKYCLCDDTLSH